MGVLFHVKVNFIICLQQIRTSKCNVIPILTFMSCDKHRVGTRYIMNNIAISSNMDIGLSWGFILQNTVIYHQNSITSLLYECHLATGITMEFIITMFKSLFSNALLQSLLYHFIVGVLISVIIGRYWWLRLGFLKYLFLILQFLSFHATGIWNARR